jgi:hypothetical protein
MQVPNIELRHSQPVLQLLVLLCLRTLENQDGLWYSGGLASGQAIVAQTIWHIPPRSLGERTCDSSTPLVRLRDLPGVSNWPSNVVPEAYVVDLDREQTLAASVCCFKQFSFPTRNTLLLVTP